MPRLDQHVETAEMCREDAAGYRKKAEDALKRGDITTYDKATNSATLALVRAEELDLLAKIEKECEG